MSGIGRMAWPCNSDHLIKPSAAAPARLPPDRTWQSLRQLYSLKQPAGCNAVIRLPVTLCGHLDLTTIIRPASGQ